MELDLSSHLSTIASIGTNAPYIGLLGTVLAIIITFYIIGEQGDNINAGEIMKNLALALKATAAGLLVAIPATAIYNALLTKVDKILATWEYCTRGPMRREKFDKINIVPFIDIVLVLLVIVLATASFIEKTGIDIDLPTASSKSKVDPKKYSDRYRCKGELFL